MVLHGWLIVEIIHDDVRKKTFPDNFPVLDAHINGKGKMNPSFSFLFLLLLYLALAMLMDFFRLD